MTVAMKGDATTSEILHNGTAVIELTSTTTTVVGDLVVEGSVRSEAQSMVRLNTAAGYGSTNTRIVRFTNVVTNQGSDITYAPSATLGDTFTINTNGVYAISYTALMGAATIQGMSLNSSQLTTNLSSITLADVLCAASAGSGGNASSAVTVYLASGSVVRAHGDAQAFSGTLQNFTIVRVA